MNAWLAKVQYVWWSLTATKWQLEKECYIICVVPKESISQLTVRLEQQLIKRLNNSNFVESKLCQGRRRFKHGRQKGKKVWPICASISFSQAYICRPICIDQTKSAPSRSYETTNTLYLLFFRLDASVQDFHAISTAELKTITHLQPFYVFSMAISSNQTRDLSNLIDDHARIDTHFHIVASRFANTDQQTPITIGIARYRVLNQSKIVRYCLRKP